MRAMMELIRTNWATMRQALAFAWSLADGRVKLFFALSAAFIFLATAASSISPVLLKLVVDNLSGSTATNAEPDFLTEFGAALGPLVLVLLYVASQVLATIIRQAQTFLNGKADQRLRRSMSARILDHILQLPLRYHLNRQTGGVSQILTNALSGYRMIIQQLVLTIAPVIFELGIAVVVVASLYPPKFMIIMGVASIAYVFVYMVTTARISEMGKKVSAAEIEAYSILTDSMLNYETVKVCTAEELTRQRYDKILQASESVWGRYYQRMLENGVLVGLTYVFSLGAALIAAVQEIRAGNMTAGDFVLIQAYMMQIITPLQTLGSAFTSMMYGATFTEKMVGLLEEPTEEKLMLRRLGDAAQPKLPPAGGGALQFDHVSFAYVEDRPTLQEISFSVEAGRTVGIVGGSGAGKSSLVRLLVRLLEPDSGRILLDGEDIGAMPLEKLRELVAVVPQDTVLFNQTLAFNIGLGRPGASQAEIEDAARAARIHDFIMRQPDGYNTIVGERGVKLSGGERQRIAIARAILRRPRIFIFDEATSSLDTRTEREILSNLMEISRGTTTLIIAHRLSTVVHADKIVVMERGQVVESGSHEWLLAKGGTYAELWRAQQKGHAA